MIPSLETCIVAAALVSLLVFGLMLMIGGLRTMIRSFRPWNEDEFSDPAISSQEVECRICRYRGWAAEVGEQVAPYRNLECPNCGAEACDSINPADDIYAHPDHDETVF